MKKILIVMLSIVLLSSMSFGQKTVKPHVKGDNAILFGFSGLGFLGAFEYQGGFGYKKFINDKTAVRGALGLNNSKETLPWDTGFTPEGFIGEDGYDKEFGISLEAAGEIHKNTGKVDPYYGGGFGLAMVRTKYAQPASGAQGSTISQTVIKNNLESNAGTTLSAFALFGVEYTINATVSLAAEYHFGFSSTSKPTMEVTNAAGDKSEFKGGKETNFGISTLGLLTLAIYLD